MKADLKRIFAGNPMGDRRKFIRSFRQRFINLIYARHNRSDRVKKSIDKIISMLGEHEVGLNIGAGGARLHECLFNLDIIPGSNIDVVSDACSLPFRDGVLRCIMSQEVFEHLSDPGQAIMEVARVLKPGGMLYLQVPFIIGYHSSYGDYWRFTCDGIRQLLNTTELEIIESGPAIGAGTSMYRISVEFFASLFSIISRRFYVPVKAFSAVVFSPFRLADRFTMKDDDTNRIPAGVYVIAKRPDT